LSTKEALSICQLSYPPRCCSLCIKFLSSIFASLDVEPGERDAALGWMHDASRAARGREGALPGNVESVPRPTGWPYDLTDAVLLESLADREGVPRTRYEALLREARKRGLRKEEPATRPAEPEVYGRRPPRR
jgi:hypothetical protein